MKIIKSNKETEEQIKARKKREKEIMESKKEVKRNESILIT